MKVSIAKVNGVLGIEVPTEDIVRILTNLGFAPVVSGDELTLMIPAYREDMEDYPDVAEEVIRMYGYDHVIPAFMPTAQVTLGGLNLRQQTERKIKRCSVQQARMREYITHSSHLLILICSDSRRMHLKDMLSGL